MPPELQPLALGSLAREVVTLLQRTSVIFRSARSFHLSIAFVAHGSLEVCPRLPQGKGLNRSRSPVREQLRATEALHLHRVYQGCGECLFCAWPNPSDKNNAIENFTLSGRCCARTSQRLGNRGPNQHVKNEALQYQSKTLPRERGLPTRKIGEIFPQGSTQIAPEL